MPTKLKFDTRFTYINTHLQISIICLRFSFSPCRYIYLLTHYICMPYFPLCDESVSYLASLLLFAVCINVSRGVLR